MNPHIALAITMAAMLVALWIGVRANYRWMQQIAKEEESMLVSTTTMIKRLEGMLDMRDLSDWEKGFVRTLVEAKDAGKVTQLTGAQVDKLDQLHGRHFA